jgi:hypothetical protein
MIFLLVQEFVRLIKVRVKFQIVKLTLDLFAQNVMKVQIEFQHRVLLPNAQEKFQDVQFGRVILTSVMRVMTV